MKVGIYKPTNNQAKIILSLVKEMGYDVFKETEEGIELGIDKYKYNSLIFNNNDINGNLWCRMCNDEYDFTPNTKLYTFNKFINYLSSLEKKINPIEFHLNEDCVVKITQKDISVGCQKFTHNKIQDFIKIYNEFTSRNY